LARQRQGGRLVSQFDDTLPNGRSDDRFSRVFRAQPRVRLDTPRPLRSSRTPAYRDRIPWQRLHLFWGDERCVPPDHPDSNYGMVHATVIAHAPVPPLEVDAIPTSPSPGAV
jgi:hypothetical protein